MHVWSHVERLFINYADLQARVYATASSHLVLIKAQSTASTSRLSDFCHEVRVGQFIDEMG
jgi:hypothetical protein